jgi:hypothetical protein
MGPVELVACIVIGNAAWWLGVLIARGPAPDERTPPTPKRSDKVVVLSEWRAHQHRRREERTRHPNVK